VLMEFQNARFLLDDISDKPAALYLQFSPRSPVK
jgi:hypothetical protein